MRALFRFVLSDQTDPICVVALCMYCHVVLAVWESLFCCVVKVSWMTFLDLCDADVEFRQVLALHLTPTGLGQPWRIIH